MAECKGKHPLILQMIMSSRLCHNLTFKRSIHRTLIPYQDRSEGKVDHAKAHESHQDLALGQKVLLRVNISGRKVPQKNQDSNQQKNQADQVRKSSIQKTTIRSLVLARKLRINMIQVILHQLQFRQRLSYCMTRFREIWNRIKLILPSNLMIWILK